jgi:hypothetical protein
MIESSYNVLDYSSYLISVSFLYGAKVEYDECIKTEGFLIIISRQ